MVGTSSNMAINVYVIRFVRSIERLRAEEIKRITERRILRG